MTIQYTGAGGWTVGVPPRGKYTGAPFARLARLLPSLLPVTEALPDSQIPESKGQAGLLPLAQGQAAGAEREQWPFQPQRVPGPSA